MRMASIAFGRTDKASVVLSAPAANGIGGGVPPLGSMAVGVGTAVVPAATLALVMHTVDDLIEKYIERVCKINTSFANSKAEISVIRQGKSGITTSIVSAELMAETGVIVAFRAAAAGFDANRSELMLEGLKQCRNVLHEFLAQNNIAGIGT